MNRDLWLGVRRGALALAIITGCAAPLYARVKKPEAASSAPQVTFVGFSADGSAGTVYVDLSQPVTVTRRESPGQIRFVMAGSVVAGENNQRPLVTEHFGTPIQRVRVVPEKEGATLEVTVTGKPSVTHRVIRGEGSARLSITAKPGAAAAARAPAGGAT
jgi:hypothetical protein